MTHRFSLSSLLSNFYIHAFTWRRGEFVGEDQYGNRYYRERARSRKDAKAANPRGPRERRWVIYNGEPEASKVPAEWSGWLHHTTAEPIKAGSQFHKPWVKEHKANLTGSLNSYRPPGHTLEGGQRARATGDYEPWTPQ